MPIQIDPGSFSGVEALVNPQAGGISAAPVSTMSARFNVPSPATYAKPNPDTMAGILIPKVEFEYLA